MAIGQMVRWTAAAQARGQSARHGRRERPSSQTANQLWRPSAAS